MPEIQSLKESAYTQIRDWILEGDLRPADPIRETEVARRLSMSRTPVRAALETLVEDGLVGIGSSGSIFVQPVTVRAIREMFEMRAAIESFAVRHGKVEPIRQTLERLMPLIRHYINQANALDLCDRSVLSELDVRLHSTIVAGLENALMSSAYKRQLDTRMAYLHGLSWSDPARTAEGAEGHAAIVIAILQGRRADAEDTLLHHLASGRTYVTDAAADDHPALNREFLREIRVRLDAWLAEDDAQRNPAAFLYGLEQLKEAT
jgi:DNA-binding GntR family transcriptional regulator